MVGPPLAAILVHSLSLATRRIVVRMPVRLHVVIGPKQTRQRAFDIRILQHLLNLWYPRHEIVAGITLFIEDYRGLFIDSIVKFRRQCSGDGDVTVDNKLPHLRVC